MIAYTFKHSFVDYMEKLKKVNFTDDQARVIVKETEDLVAQVFEQTCNEIEKKNSASKADLEITKLALINEIELTRKEISQLESRLIKWVIGVGIASVISLSGIIKLIIH